MKEIDKYAIIKRIGGKEMMKKSKKAIFIVLITIIITLIPTNHTYALSDLIAGAQGFITIGESATTSTNGLSQSSVVDMSNQILSVLIPLGTIVAVLMAAYLGIKFMTGSAEDQAKVKETLIPYVVGCIVVFGGFTIWKLVIEVFGASLG